ncbi:NlpC/P60 family protein [Streptomyces sp. DT171]|uniref:C40 family peptidase n=1 Tax=Streptomyces sp. DT171 TaxID=3416524 RepID=UPI003CEDE626
MASHRKPRTRVRDSTTVAGLTTVALASVTLLSAQSATAAPAPPKQRIEDVRKRVDDLYRQAGTATQRYDRAKEASTVQRGRVDALLEDVARRTDRLNDARRTLGAYAAAQYRNGSIGPNATFFLANDPQSYFDQDQLMSRMTGAQRKAVTDFRTERTGAAEKRAEAVRNLDTLTKSQAELRTSKQDVRKKLTEARATLSKLTAQEKARLAELEREKQAEAARKSRELARRQAAEAKADAAAREAAGQPRTGDGGTGSGTGGKPGSGTGGGGGTDTGGSTGSGPTAKARTVLDFARAQIGKPYVWGATGPSSYDCSGLTQAAWRAAGVSLPRTTWDQVKVGTRVATSDLQPGDLVFFYDDISHVGIYKGGGVMIHAPKPGANVREESIYYMPIYGSVRPA